jgi:splicing factor 3A subunit 3
MITFVHVVLFCRQYLQQLLAYLVSFYERTQPLAQLSKQLDKIQAETEEAFQQGQVLR